MKLLRIILLCVLCFVLGCSNDEELLSLLEIKNQQSEVLSGGAIHLLDGANSATFEVESNGAWRIMCDAEWLTFEPLSGSGDASVVVRASEAESSRSAVVTVALADYANQYRSFDVVQWVSSNDEPTPPADDPTDPNDPTDDPPTGGDNGDPTDNPTDDPTDDPKDDPQPTPLYGDFGEALNLAAIRAGRYYIGGYCGEELHLALGEISSVGHCRTARFAFDESGEPVNGDSEQAAVVELVSADGGYYLRFEGCGYLMATSASAGALVFVDEPAVWQFAESAEGGFEVRQAGEVDAQLIFSPRAQSDLLRSIAGDEQGGGVRLFLLQE
jgi:hypothetical protein